jgi:hypothetical protein
MLREKIVNCNANPKCWGWARLTDSFFRSLTISKCNNRDSRSVADKISPIEMTASVMCVVREAPMGWPTSAVLPGHISSKPTPSSRRLDPRHVRECFGADGKRRRGRKIFRPIGERRSSASVGPGCGTVSWKTKAAPTETRFRHRLAHRKLDGCQAIDISGYMVYCSSWVVRFTGICRKTCRKTVCRSSASRRSGLQHLRTSLLLPICPASGSISSMVVVFCNKRGTCE